MSGVLKLIVDGPLPGETNMAVDRALLDACGTDGVPVLRFYQWERPTLSLGYFQKAEQVSPLSFPDAQVDLCRRPTGGGAILHHLELTFSLTLPEGHALLKGPVEQSYLNLCRPVLERLRALGLEVSYRGDPGSGSVKAANCFAGLACPDIVVDGKKIFGAAQRRRDGAVGRSRRASQALPMVPEDHRLCRRASRRARVARALARQGEADAGELDRPLRRAAVPVQDPRRRRRMRLYLG